MIYSTNRMRWHWTLISSLSLLPLGAGALRAQAPATEPAATQPTTQAVAEEPEPNMPVIDAKSIKSVVKLSVEDKMLRLSTDLPATPEPTIVRIPNFPGRTVAVVRGPEAAPPGDPTPPATISIRHEMPSPSPNQATIYTMSSIGYDHLALSVDSEDPVSMRSVQYIQMTVSPDNPDPNEKPVKLYVSVHDKVNSTKPVDLKLMADNVIDLRRKYPRETAEYLQPLLATLGQESVPFAVDRRTAWQVLAKHWQVDPKVDEQVQKLVKQLDAEEYAARETASEQLDKLGESAVLSILRMSREKMTSEQNSRLDAFLAPYRPLSDEEARRLTKDVPFLIDCLYSDPAIRDTALRQLRELTGKPLDVKTDVSSDEWLTTVRQIRNELLPPPATKSAATQSVE